MVGTDVESNAMDRNSGKSMYDLLPMMVGFWANVHVVSLSKLLAERTLERSTKNFRKYNEKQLQNVLISPRSLTIPTDLH